MVSPMNFQILSPEQANPLGYGLRQGNEILSGILKNRYLPQALQYENQKAQLANALAEIKLPYAEKEQESMINYRNAMAQMYTDPRYMNKFLSPVGKSIVEPSLLRFFPKNNGQDSNLTPNQQAAYEAYTSKQARNQQQALSAQQSQHLYNDVKDINVDLMKGYTGIAGAGKQLFEKGKGLFGIEQDPNYVEFEKYKESTSKRIGDILRKTWGTSVIPSYVREMLMPIINPGMRITASPEVIEATLNEFKQWAFENAQQATTAYSKGTPTTLQESEQNYSNYEDEYNQQNASSLNQNENIKKLSDYTDEELDTMSEKELNYLLDRAHRKANE